jgi:hypothetical protein
VYSSVNSLTQDSKKTLSPPDTPWTGINFVGCKNVVYMPSGRICCVVRLYF